MEKNVLAPGEPLPISWRLAQAGTVILTVYNSAGEYIGTIYSGDSPSDEISTVSWSPVNSQGRPLSSNVYIIRISGPRLPAFARFALSR